MTLPARTAIVDRLTDVRREPALQVGKLGARHRSALSSEINAMCGSAIYRQRNGGGCPQILNENAH